MQRRSSPPGYSTREVARLLGIAEGRVRSWVRSGFLTPRRGARGQYRFSFQDLVVLQAAQGLSAARIGPRRLREALRRLRQQLPKGRSLSEVRITAEGSQVVVREGRQSWEPESGQTVLDFEVAELAEKAAPLAPAKVARAHAREDLEAEDWFELGWELEPAAPEEAITAYRQALALDAGHADAHLNLGRLLHEAGELEAAERHYRRALDLAPADSTAAFNLGVVLQDRGRVRPAIEAYRRAVAIDPDCADAHFNLADLYGKQGEKAAAIRSLKTYRSLVRRS